MMTGSKTLLCVAGILVAGTVLSGCVGGTTYGTGVTQEQQTIEDLANLITFRKKRQQITYKSRPDLVVPEEKVLVDPQTDPSTVNDQDWPESPEARIARIRADAAAAENGDAEARARQQENLRQFRSVSPGQGVVQREAPPGKGIPNVSCDPDGQIMRRCTPGEISDAVRQQRASINSVGKTGYQRRYLTEPPIEYRTPASTAAIGDEGYTEAELEAIEAEKKRKRALEDKPG